MVGAAFILFLLYRVSQNTAWDKNGYTSDQTRAPFDRTPPPPVPAVRQVVEDRVKIPDLKTSLEVKNEFALPTPTTTDVDAPPVATPTEPAAVDIPDRLPGNVGDVYAPAQGNEKEKPPAEDVPEPIVAPTPHWRKLPEHFPVADEDLIPLPTGKPKPVPKVQHDFAPESPEAKAKREDRLAQVKTEMQRAWTGYRTYAFGHDELAPLSKDAKDPFCGWAATLVDSLDTLWIMGLKEEFEDAYYLGLKNIDFSTTPFRNDIPVFETTIRYLGGLLAAYDVTGGQNGKYQLLLSKAVELAEILMGIFDTPNRMPVLYYGWKPESGSQPHRASSSSGIAELGTLSMEFTRLAQLTGKDKYYDAIARITDALHEWQGREGAGATALRGIFPQNVDASGCNTTLPTATPVPGPVVDTISPPQEQGQAVIASQGTPDKAEPNLEFEVKPGNAEGVPATGEPKKLGKRSAEQNRESPMMTNPPPQVPEHRLPEHRLPEGNLFQAPDPLAGSTVPADWDAQCSPQKLISGGYGFDSYSMGGSQDSAYEYFPKQYLLLGGLEPKYREMHERTVGAVKNYLLFEPMIKEDRDILFSGKINARGNTDTDLSYVYEVTHLTCFLGGMFGLGSKIFNSPEDLDIGKRLTDGCVWAYDVMPSGIMPEFGIVSPCSNPDNCSWNETEWHENLDPRSEWREGQMEDYKIRMAEWEVARKQTIREHAETLQALEDLKKLAASMNAVPTNAPFVGEKDATGGAPEAVHEKDGVPRRDDNTEYRKPISKRDMLSPEPPRVDQARVAAKAVEEAVLQAEAKLPPPDEKAIEEKVKKLEEELSLNGPNGQGSPSGAFGGLVGQVPIDQVEAPELILPMEPIRPKTHQEYVQELIEREHLPPGFVNIHDKRYILR